MKRMNDGGPVYTVTTGKTRRQFLKCAGAAGVALPLLESLMPTEVSASELTTPKRFVGMMTHHGGVWPENTYPGMGTATNPVPMPCGWDAHWGELSAQTVDGEVQVSPFVRAPGSVLSDALISKMMLIRGLDKPFWMGHGRGAALGNFNDSNYDADDPVDSLVARPTIDQVMAWSPCFYSDLSATTMRSIHLGADWPGNIAFGYTNPAEQSGPVVDIPTIDSSIALFNQTFPGANAADEPRPLVVDQVMESYRSLRSGAFGNASRLSASDRQRLDDHLSRLDELQRKLSAASCSDIDVPTEDAMDAADRAQAWSMYNDVLVAAFICGTSRIATISPSGHWYPGVSEFDWHQEVAHRADEPSALVEQQMMLESHRNWFRYVLLDLANKLDIEEADGRTYLDNSLLMYTSESGCRTHNPHDHAVVTLGGAGDFFATGRMYDYRNRDDMGRALNDDFLTQRPGLYYNQWLATALQSMDLPEDEWQWAGERGYGGAPNGFDGAVGQMASDVLPGIRG
ncbi:MAG: DUF1552 domain-containing protein [Nannocystales bacterium]